jgi:hypothetical protein
MTADSAEISAELLCHSCGYDLRAHPKDGKCPECGASVAEAHRVGAVPLRPAWRDSDPRWRRHMLAGAWILLLLPLVDLLRAFGWTSSLTVPTVIDYRGPLLLEETLLFWPGVYRPLVFCIGVVLLFSKERGRRRGKLDWTRRWGVLCSYVVLLLSAVPVLFIASLVLVGISAMFIAIPFKYQPGVIPLFVNLGTTYLYYGPQPKANIDIVLVAFSSIGILLACIALFDALRSSGPRLLAQILLAPLAAFSLIYLAQVGEYFLRFPNVTSAAIAPYGEYFRPEFFVGQIGDLPSLHYASGSTLGAFATEAAKWLIVLAIAVWLTLARLAAWWRRRKRGPAT